MTDSDELRRKVHLAAIYQDILVKHAFGNFRDILQDVTYSPLMGEWLSYMGNEKEDPVVGSMPDENYAREWMQLFSIGLVKFDDTRKPKTDSQGDQIQTYDAEDIRDVAKVFTGLYSANVRWQGAINVYPQPYDLKPMVMHNDYHPEGTKTFLGSTIPNYGDSDKTIDHAFNLIFNHPNVGPFIGEQLIKRFTTSNPGPSYILRVSRAVVYST